VFPVSANGDATILVKIIKGSGESLLLWPDLQLRRCGVVAAGVEWRTRAIANGNELKNW
jgi:hypothetical protein